MSAASVTVGQDGLEKIPMPKTPSAHIIKSDQEALEIAARLADEFAPGASRRDQERLLPSAEIEAFSRSGLWGATVPKEYGGAGISNVTLADFIRIIAVADSSIAQIPQNHLYMIEALRLDGTQEQKRHFFGLALSGTRFGNAFSEIGTKSVQDVRTRLTRSGSGYLLNGKKFYSTGALLAHWIPVVALDEHDHVVVAFVERGAKGLTLVNDWSSFGQCATASGSTILDNVLVKPEHVLQHWKAFERHTTIGAVAQIIQAAIDVGISQAALNDTLEFVRKHSRPWIDAGVEKATDDPLLLYKVGETKIKVDAAEAILRRAGEYIDRAFVDNTESSIAAAAIAVGEAKAISEEAALWAADRLNELAGTRSTLAEYNYDRHWRNARTHTLHDPSRWKYYAIGNYVLNGVNPPRHAWF